MVHYSFGEGHKFDVRAVHAPELWTVSWNVGGDFGAVSSCFAGMHGAVCRSPWILMDESCLRCGSREAKRSVGIFSLAGERTTTLAFVVKSPIGLRAW